MRADLRDALFGDVDAAHALQNALKQASGAAATEAADHVATPDRFEGTDDLTPLDDSNTFFAALVELATLLRDERVRSYAILAPTNYKLLHEYIDCPAYEDRAGYHIDLGRGCDQSGGNDGDLISASSTRPMGIVISSLGDVFVADFDVGPALRVKASAAAPARASREPWSTMWKITRG